MSLIQSSKNNYIKDLRKLARKKERLAQQRYLIEGIHLVKEVLKSNAKVQAVLATEAFEQSAWLDGVAVQWISGEVAKTLGETITTQGIFAVIELPELERPATLNGAWLLLDQIQDPGNIGTMVRTADAAGFNGVVLGQDSADLYSPKVVRSMQGSQFHITIYESDLLTWFADFKAAGIPVYGSELNEGAADFRTIKSQNDFALVMGNEGNGMQASLLEMTTKNLYIPIKGQAESLNVAVAAGILMFQLSATN
ncbi:TrmH family RNA methyltransferase [Loigolactobacillus backii]|uniref:RNA methyltransferase n=1 Tax=Loigolactobacillus backii TaxID=375175 RepID=A0A192H3C1_9LACO|nr:RNA methyltransferase [Loigolactobacillus backii]ANK59319.1 RNA methyltransferase [Loigolactobacillus backii]ANK62732.1 RNA methyltransferase [Loigolactobacillus backii]ANK64311.1 RNA methyltransferase [Loigolactobacillus backii]ANK67294.1 RNA methyltransferase [Loigolactobacillus backii]ANK70260.1 RNA methyltransferase [Loigolactobacillus backii]